MKQIRLDLKVEYNKLENNIVLFFYPMKDLDKEFLMFTNIYLHKKNLGYLSYNREEEYFYKKINISKISEIHSMIHFSGIQILVNNIDFELNKPCLIEKFRIKDKILAIRTTLNKEKLCLSYIDDYEGSNQELHDYFMEQSKENHKKKNIIFFEKKSLTYGESAYSVFEKYYQKNNDFYFVLSKTNEDFSKLKDKFGDQLIEKGSVEMINKLLECKLLVSSELPTHLISDRNFEYEMMDYIYKIPYFFLQHGVMFSKPILNPMARGFWKKNIQYNLVKTVVSSELEKEEFFKVGFIEDDLCKTGLASYDNINRNETKDRIVYMPTYRSWEEFSIYNNNIKGTTYYQDIINVVESFKKIGMIDQLTIIPHPKFVNVLKEESIPCDIETSYTDIRDKIKLLITDFSSVSYDAHFRGAYIIYLWNRRDELEKNYKSKSPLNYSNCDGVPVDSYKELEYEVMYADRHNYKLDDFYERNYMKIVEFNDNKNTDRIYNEISNLINDFKEEN